MQEDEDSSEDIVVSFPSSFSERKFETWLGWMCDACRIVGTTQDQARFLQDMWIDNDWEHVISIMDFLATPRETTWLVHESLRWFVVRQQPSVLQQITTSPEHRQIWMGTVELDSLCLYLPVPPNTGLTLRFGQPYDAHRHLLDCLASMKKQQQHYTKADLQSFLSLVVHITINTAAAAAATTEAMCLMTWCLLRCPQLQTISILGEQQSSSSSSAWEEHLNKHDPELARVVSDKVLDIRNIVQQWRVCRWRLDQKQWVLRALFYRPAVDVLEDQLLNENRFWFEQETLHAGFIVKRYKDPLQCMPLDHFLRRILFDLQSLIHSLWPALELNSLWIYQSATDSWRELYTGMLRCTGFTTNIAVQPAAHFQFVGALQHSNPLELEIMLKNREKSIDALEPSLRPELVSFEQPKNERIIAQLGNGLIVLKMI